MIKIEINVGILLRDHKIILISIFLPPSLDIVHDEPREIQFWISNVNATQSFISLAVRGHSLFRLNYPMRMKQWHHTCTSWNGKTGEWQLWVKSDRVGRGFYNRVSVEQAALVLTDLRLTKSTRESESGKI